MRVRDPCLLPWLAGFALLIAVLGLSAQYVNDWLVYDDARIADGEWWRLLSCHLVHLNHWHMLLNLGGFLLCCYFFVDIYTRRLFFAWLLLSAPVVGVLFHVVDGLEGRYAGLSGLLHGWLVIGLLAGWRTHPWLHSLVLALITGRIIWEQLPGYDVDYMAHVIDGSVYVNAHLYGALVGAVIGVLALIIRSRATPDRAAL